MMLIHVLSQYKYLQIITDILSVCVWQGDQEEVKREKLLVCLCVYMLKV